jgi:hypothetical protein
VQQFPELRVLSANDNCIGDFEQLGLLARACPALEAASFEGNPVAQLPHYRCGAARPGGLRVPRAPHPHAHPAWPGLA